MPTKRDNRGTAKSNTVQVKTKDKKARGAKKQRKPNEKISACTTLDILKSIYKNDPSEEQTKEILKNKISFDCFTLLENEEKLQGDWEPPKSNEKIMFRHFLISFGVHLNNDSTNCFSKERLELISNIYNLLSNFTKDLNLKELRIGLEKFGLIIKDKKIRETIDPYDSCCTVKQIDMFINSIIQSQLLHSIVPLYRNSIVETEQEITRQSLGPLFGFTTLFSNCSGSSNSSISNFIYCNRNITSIVPNFQPDDFTCVEYKNHKFIKLIREDSSVSYNHHTLHKDFIPLLAQMQLSLAFTARKLIKSPLKEWHNELLILGVTGEPTKSNLYALSCKPTIINGNIELTYMLTHLGSYHHFDLKQRISLVSILISNLCFPKVDEVLAYLTTQQTQEMNMNSPSKKRKIVTSFPSLITINYSSFSVNYETDAIQINPKIKYCTINDIRCVAKREKRFLNFTFLNLSIFNTDGFSVSLRGECLADLLDNPQKASEIDVQSFFYQTLTMLHLIHSSKLTHNDIKPENIVKYDNHWFFIDFETCTEFSRYDKEAKCFVKDDTLMISKFFSAGYRSPERKNPFQYQGIDYRGRVSPQSDIYSLGLVLLEVLSRKRIGDLENPLHVAECLNNLEIENETIKRVLPLMLAVDFEMRPTVPTLLNTKQMRMDTKVLEFYKDRSKYKDLFPEGNNMEDY